MAPAPSPPKSSRGLQQRLTAKVGPLPVWGWAALILAAYLLYSRLARSSPSSSTDQTAVPAGPAGTAGGSGGSAQIPVSGQGSPADNMNGPLLDAISANTAAADALTNQILTAPLQALPVLDFGDAPTPGMQPAVAAVSPTGDPLVQPPEQQAPSAISQQGPAASPTPGPQQLAPSVSPHQTQTQAGMLSWDGLTFTSRASFDHWAKAHGTTSQAIFKTHPAARNIYGTLR